METAEALAARLRANPGDRAAFAALRAHYEQQGDYASLANLLAGWAGWVTDDRAASDAMVEVADLLASTLQDPARAEEYYIEAARRDAENLAAVEALQALWEASQQHARVLELLQQQLDRLAAVPNSQRTSALLRLRLGLLLDEVFAQPEQAMQAFRKAVELDPSLVRATYEARRMCMETGDMRGAAEFYEREVGAEPELARRLTLLIELSNLYRDQLDDLDGAVSALQRAQSLAPADAALAYDLAALLVLRAEHADARTAHGDRARAAELLTAIARGVDREQAVAYLVAALGYAPEYEPAMNALERLLENTDQHLELARHWVAHLAVAADGRASHRRRVKLARAYAAQGQVDDARFCLQPAASAGFPAALELLDDLGSDDAEQPEIEPLEPDADEIDVDAFDPNAFEPERKPTPPPSAAVVARSTRPPPRSRARQEQRATVEASDYDDIKTVVGEPEMIENLREATGGLRETAPPVLSPAEAFAQPALEDDEFGALDSEPGAGASAASASASARPVIDPRQLRREASELANRQQNDEAAQRYQWLLEHDPTDREAFAFLDSYYRRGQQHLLRAELLEAGGTTPLLALATRSSRLREAASVYESRLKDYDRAARAMHQWAALEPDNDEAQRGLKRLLERAERWDELAVLIEADVSHASEREMRVTLLRRLLVVHREKRGDLEAAADVLHRLLLHKPDDRGTREALLDTWLELGRFDEAAELLEQKVRDAATKPQKLALLQQLARLFREQTQDNDRAFATYERILELSPYDADALEQMAALDQSSGNLERLLATLERQAKRLEGAQAAEVVARMAGIAQRDLQAEERAIELWQRAIELAPEEPAHVQALLAFYEERERHADLVELLRERAVLERNPLARVELFRRIAHVHETQLNDADGAHDAWQDLLRIREDREALTALQHRAIERDQPELLVDALKRLAAISGVAEEKRDLLFDRAALFAERLGNPGEAIRDLTRILTEVDAGFDPALVALRAASDAAGEHKNLARVLEQRLAGSDPAEQLALARDLADIYQHKLEDAEGTIRMLMRWAELDGQNPEPHRRLKPLFGRTRRNPQLLVVLDALSELEPDPNDRARSAIEAAELAARLDDADGAWRRLVPLVERRVNEATEAIVSLARSHKRLAELYDLLERTGHVERLLQLLRERVRREQTPALRATLLRRMAQLLIDYAQDEEGAAAAYRELLEIEEDVDALRFLQARAVRNDDPETLVSVLARLAALESTPGEQRELLFERARLLHTRLERAPEAVAALLALSEQDPELETVWDELVRACETARDYATLAGTLERMLARTPAADGRVVLAARLADLCEHELSDATRAISALQAWAAADGQDPAPQRRARPLLSAAHRDGELLACLDALARIEPDPAARLDATLAAAAVARNQLNDAEGAWNRLLPYFPAAHAQVDKALYTLATEAGRYDELYAVLEECGRHETLATWLGQRVVHERDTELRVALMRRLARTLAGPLEDPDRAEQAWSQLLGVQEDLEALSFIRTYALQRDDVARLADALRRLSLLESDPIERRDLMYEHGHVLRARLARPADAVIVLYHVLELDPEFEPALDELIEASKSAGDAAALAWAIERAAPREPDPERRIELTAQLVELCTQRLHQPERAIAALRFWVESAPGDPAPHARIFELLGEQGDPALLIAELDAIAAKHPDPNERMSAALRAAQITLDRAADPALAWLRLLPLLSQGSSDAEALASRIAFNHGKIDELIAAYEAAERFDDLVLLLRQQAERTNDPLAKADLFRRCARLLAGALQDEVAAVEAYREVLSLQEDVEALTFLRGEAQRMDDPEELAGVLDRLARLATTPEEQRDLLVERALLLADRLERGDDALALLRRVLLELDPDCAVAIDELVALCEVRDDFPGLALGLERQLAHTSDARARVDIAQRLATIAEDKLHEPERAIAALAAWSASAPNDPAPLRRLRTLLQGPQRAAELLQVLDQLSTCELGSGAQAEAAVAAAELADSALQDPQGALERLSRPLLAYDERAEAAAHRLAQRAGLLRPLANLFVVRAQAPQSQHAVADWVQASRLYEQLGEPAEALEANLRALALDMSDRNLLDAIDRLADTTQAWERLSRVYTRLIQDASPAVRCQLLVRQADLLETRASDPGAALDQILKACRIDPLNGDLLDRADALANRLGAHLERAWIAERRVQAAGDDETRARQLMRHAEIADLGLKDREQAIRSLTKALTLSEHSPQVAAEIEDVARNLDRARPELGRGDAMRSLIRAHIELAQRLGEPFGPLLVLRASQLLRSDLEDESACFDVLKQGATLFPDDLDLYDALERSALQIKRLDALDAHLSRAVQRSNDAELRLGLLQRRGNLLGEHLKRYGKAAEVFRELLSLAPNDEGARRALPDMLRRDGRYQDLLRLYDEWLQRTNDPSQRVELMREKAKLWELELRNRSGAIEVWRKVLELSPDDSEASAMLARLHAP